MERVTASWGARARAALDTLGSAPWRRAPWLLLRRPGVLVPTAGAAAVVAASLAAVPLFLSSAGTEAVEVQAAARCPRDTGATYRLPPGPGSRAPGPDPFVPLADGLGPSTRWGRIETWLAGPGPTSRTPVVVLARDGAVDHVDVVEGEPQSGGVWLSDRAVALTGRGPEADAVLGGVAVPVAGVYRDLVAGTISDPFWCAHRPDLLLQGADLEPPPPVVVTDRATWMRLAASAEAEAVEAAWEAPLRTDVTVAEARGLVDELACTGGRSGDLAWCAPDAGVVRGDEQPAALGGQRIEPPAAAVSVEQAFSSSLPFVADRARSIQTAVGAGVWPVAVLAALAGLALVAATAQLWTDRRRREVVLLGVRGSSPLAVAGKAVLELAVALLLGSAAGVVLAYALVVTVGPSSTLEPTAVTRAAHAGVVAALLSVVVVASVVAARAAAPIRDRERSRLRLAPWELLLVAATVVSFLRLDEWGVPVSQGAEVSRVDVVGLLFPVLFLGSMVAVASRLLVAALSPIRALSRDWPTPAFLAVRRVARYRAAVIAMVAASALATGVFAYAATVHRSMDASLHAKAQVYLGSDVVVRVPPDEVVPDGLAARSTAVAYYRSAWVDLGTRAQVNVFAIDPATFARAAFWDGGLAPVPLEVILDRLAAPPSGGRVPALVVGLDVPTVVGAGIVTAGTTEFEIREVAEVTAFPGMRRGSPALFVAGSALEDLGLSSPVRELWIRGDPADVFGALDAATTRYEVSTTATGVVDAVDFLTVSQTFGFMRSLAVASALLAIGGLAVYVDARRRSRVLAHAFARRMGLSRRQHRRALVLEGLAGAGVGCWLGLAVAVLGAHVALVRIDPLPLVRPDPLLRPPTVLLVVLGLAAVAVTVIAAALAQRAADRDDPLEVLRAGH